MSLSFLKGNEQNKKNFELYCRKGNNITNVKEAYKFIMKRPKFTNMQVRDKEIEMALKCLKRCETPLVLWKM